jgi:hypothetical protein
VRIVDRDGLLDTCCECYSAINAHILRLSGWLPQVPPPPSTQ